MTRGGSVSSSNSSYQRPLVTPKKLVGNEFNQPVSDQKPSMEFVDEKAWDAASAKCYGCKETVPHKLLFICRYERCDGLFEERGPCKMPSEFYEDAKVFCSKCCFVGIHKRHVDYLEEAHTLAVKMSSMSEDLQMTFKKLAFLDHEDPVDFVITNEFEIEQLPVLQATEYLFNAADTTEWKQRKHALDDLKKTVDQCRMQGNNYVKEYGTKALETWENFSRMVEDDLKGTESPKKNNKRVRHRENSSKTTSPLQDNDRKTVKTVTNSHFAPSSITTAAVASTGKETPVSMTTAKNEADEITAKMICRNLNLYFDQIRDDMRIEHALQSVSDKLGEASGSLENKLAAARMFREKNNVALYYPPQ